MIAKQQDIKILVVGGAGYIGGAVVEELRSRNLNFTVYDVLLYEDRYLKPVDFIYGDVRDTEKLKSILPYFSHVIWLAAIVGDGACALQPEIAVEINELMPKWLSENFNGKIVFTSTCSVYGSNEKEVSEDDQPNPLSLYAKTKLSAERYIINKNSAILRLGTAFGISDLFSRPRFDLLVNTLTRNAVVRGEISIFGGDQWRPNIHVKDIAKAIITACLDDKIKGIYNIATENYTIKEIGELVSKITGCKIKYTQQLYEDKRNYRVNFNKALQAGLITLPTKYNVEYGIREIANLVKSGRVKDAYFNLYSNENYLSKRII